MTAYLVLGGDYKKWSPRESLALALIEEILRRELSCSFSTGELTGEQINASCREVLFAEIESPCFFGLGLKASNEVSNYEVIVDVRDPHHPRIFTGGQRSEALESKLGQWPKTSSHHLIEELERVRLNVRS